MRCLTIGVIACANVALSAAQSESQSALAFEAASIRPTSFDRLTLVERMIVERVERPSEN